MVVKNRDDHELNNAICDSWVSRRHFYSCLFGRRYRELFDNEFLIRVEKEKKMEFYANRDENCVWIVQRSIVKWRWEMVERLLLLRFVLWGKEEIVERLIWGWDLITPSILLFYFFLKIYKIYMHTISYCYFILFYFF